MKLVCLSTELSGREFEVSGERFIIGRSPDSDVVFDQVSVSRSHAQIALENGRYVIRDLNSRNGIEVEGKQVDEATIGPGQIVSIGDVQVQVVFDPPPLPAGAAAGQVPPLPPTGAAHLPVAPSAAPALGGAPAPAAFQPPPPAPAAAPNALGAAPTVAESPSVQGASLNWLYGILFALVLAGSLTYIFWPETQTGPDLSNVMFLKMKRNEQKAIAMPRGIFYNTEDVQVSEEGMVEVVPFSSTILALIAKDAGMVDITCGRTHRRPVIVRLLVKGSLPDPLEELRDRPMREEQRVESARQNVFRGDSLRRTDLYEAIKLYRIAVEILRPLPVKPPVYHEARNKLRESEKELEKRWADLRFDYLQLIKTENMTGAMQTLMLMRSLMHDPKDWRRQVVDIYVQKLNKALARQKHRK